MRGSGFTIVFFLYTNSLSCQRGLHFQSSFDERWLESTEKRRMWNSRRKTASHLLRCETCGLELRLTQKFGWVMFFVPGTHIVAK